MHPALDCVWSRFSEEEEEQEEERGGIGGREEGDKEKRWRRNMRIGRRRRSRCVWSRMRMRVGPRVWDTLPMHMPACIVHKASTLILCKNHNKNDLKFDTRI